MARALDEDGNIWDVTDPDNPVLVQAAQGAQPAQRQGGFIPDPYAAEDQALEARRVANAEANTARQNEIADRQAAISERNIAIEERKAAIEEEERVRQLAGREQSQLNRYEQVKSILGVIGNLRDMSADWLALGSLAGNEGFRDSSLWSWLGVNQNANNVAGNIETLTGDLIQQVKAAAQERGGNVSSREADTEREAQRLAASIANLSQAQNRDEFLKGLDRAERFYREAFENLGGDPLELPPTGSGREAYVRALEPAGYGATEASVPYPPEMEDEHAAWLRSRGGNIDPEDYVEFRQSLDRKYNRQSDPDDLREWARQAQDYVNAGGDPASLGITPINRDLTDGFLGEQFRNDIISNPWGAGAASFANAGGFGIPSLFAGDQYAMMRDANPIASTVGEIGGGVTGALTGGGILSQLARGVSNPRAASLLANPITADVGYGGIYGATQADDPLYGAAGGVAGALAGNYIGSQIGRRLPGAVGFRRPQDPLNRGERAIINSSADMDSVAAALAQADSMGVPMTGADAAPELLSLAGAATRFSPTAGGTARNVMQERNLGQLGRYRQAIERDLGPIANIPQRSEDLIQQARQQAAPLYDQAYAAPGASSVQIDDLTSRPTFRQALLQAYREVADEGLDPTTLGFDLNDAGEVVLSRTPSWQTLDYVKRGLDNVIEAETDAINGISSAGRRAVSMKNDLLGRMDNINPAYAQARAAYAGPAAERQMLREGQLAASENPDQLSLDATSLSPAQREQMQLGFQSQLSSNAGRLRDNSNPWGHLYTDDAAQRLGTLYPEDGVANLLAQRDLELQLAGNSNRLIGNSMTAERGVADELFRAPPSVAGDVGQGIAETALFGGPWLSAGRGIANRLFRERAQASANAQNMQLADEVAALLLNPSPTASADALADVAARNAAYTQSLDEITNRALVRGGHVGAGVGGVTAGLLAR